MTPEDPRWKKKKPDLNEPVPLPQRYDPIVPIEEKLFEQYKPLKKKRGLKFVTPKGSGERNNRGTL